jgi:hypothetical protein
MGTYGTLSPCEMLKKEVKRQFIEEYASGSKSGWEAAGSALALGLGGRLIDEMIDTMSPVKCLGRLVDIKFRGVKPFDPATIGTLQNFPASPATTSAPCKVDHFTWRNSKGLEILFIEGLVSPATTRMIYIQLFDANDKFLGTTPAGVMPGGSFSASIDRRNPTNELKIKYTCG